MEFTGVLLHLDGVPDSSGESFAPGVEVDMALADKILVTRGFDRGNIEFSKIIGTGVVTKEDNKLMYKLKLLPEQISEQEARLLKPCAGGSVDVREGKVIKSFSISSVGLALENADSRIKRLGEES